MSDTNAKENSNIFWGYVDELCNKVLHINQKDFSEATGISESTISTWKTNGFKWRQISENQIIVLAMYFGEEITDKSTVIKKFNELCPVDPQIKNRIRSVIKKILTDKLLDRMKQGQEFVKNRYQQNEDNKEIDFQSDEFAFMKKHYPTFIEEMTKDFANHLSDTDEKIDSSENGDSQLEEAIPNQPINADLPKDEEVQSEEPIPNQPINADLPKDEEVQSEEPIPNQPINADSPKDEEIQSEEPIPNQLIDADSSKNEESLSKEATMEIDPIKMSSGEKIRSKADSEYEKAQQFGKKSKKRIEHLERAADLGNPFARYDLGLAYKEGTVVQKDPQKAVECFFRAGKMKLGDAVYELKECYQYGIGVEKKHTKRKAVWLMMILNANHYQQEKCDVDISMDTELQLKKAQDYVKKWKRFNPETDEERKLKELIEIWGGIK